MQKSAMGYHTATSYDRRGLGGHYMDWHNQPSPYKTYPGVAPLDLPEAPGVSAQSLWGLLTLQDSDGLPSVLDRSLLARVLTLSFSLTAESRPGGQPFYYRSVASAGALYPNEVYVAANGIPGLDPGLFHYGIRRRDLAPLRRGHTGCIAGEACGDPNDPCAALFLISGVFFRSAWKYRARAFRYVLLDAGHLLLNLLLALRASKVPGALVYAFDDPYLNRFLGLDPRLEACLAGVKIPGRAAVSAPKPSEIDDLPPAFLAASRAGAREVLYPEIEAGYRSGLNPAPPGDSPPDLLGRIGPRPERWSDPIVPEPSGPETAYPECVFNRRSRRNYVNTPLERQTFERLLDLVCRAACGMQNPATAAASTIALGILVGRVSGVPPGFYLLDPVGRRTGLVAAGDIRSPMAAVCLDQDWLANAGVHFLCMTNLDELDRHWGPRGYRYAMLTAGGIGQALYLGAAALGLGCCGIGALYDGEARDLLGLNTESALLYLVALGVVKRW